MQQTKLIHQPVTIVGILSNVVALTLVCVLLNAERRQSFPELAKLASSIRQIAATKKVSPDDLIELLGKVSLSFQGESYWNGAWDVPKRDSSNSFDLNYTVMICSDDAHSYRVVIIVCRSNGSGFRYLCENLVKAVKGGSLLPFEPYEEIDSERLILTAP